MSDAPSNAPQAWPALSRPLCLDTPRLQLRPWSDADRAPYAALCADPEVMRHFPAVQSRAQCDASIDAWQAQFAERGWSNWAVVRRGGADCIGFVGLTVPQRVLPFTPCVEIGWRLARSAWGQGLASEAARAVLDAAFGPLGLDEVLSFTAVLNTPSLALMQRLGLQDRHAPFDHPALPEGHPLRPHRLFGITRAQWRATDHA